MVDDRKRWARQTVQWTGDHGLLLTAFALGLAMRCVFGPVLLGSDFDACLLPWYKATVAHGGLKSLGVQISDYSSPYMYLLALASYLPVPPTTAIKAIPCAFDFVGAIALYRLARLFHPEGVVPAIVACCFLFCPTVLINSALWAQCDVIYSTFLVFALLAALRKHPLASAMLFSVAFGFKLQAVFFLPALATIFMLQGFSIVYFVLTPAFYLVASVPPILLGRSATSVLGVYLHQFDNAGSLTMNAASVYQWLPVSSEPDAQVRGGLAFAAGACALAAYVIVRLSRRPFRTESLLSVAFFLAALPPFLLPKMHERYAFISDVLACIVPFVTPALAVPALLLMSASFVSYGPFIGSTWMPLPYATVLNLVALVLMARHLGRELGITEALNRTVKEDDARDEARVSGLANVVDAERVGRVGS